MVTAVDPALSKSYIEDMTANLTELVVKKSAEVEASIKSLDGPGGDNPKNLAEYQRVMSVYSILSNAQASVVKSLKDTDMTIIREFN